MAIKDRALTYQDKQRVMTLLHQLWAMTPDLRFGQLLVNALGQVDLFNVEDDELVRLVAEFVKEHA